MRTITSQVPHRTHGRGLARRHIDETTYRALLSQFLNDYWGAFHEALEAQSVNPRMLADSLFDALVAAHERCVAARHGVDEALERLGRLWNHVAERRTVTVEAPLSAREVEYARAQFETMYDTLITQGTRYHKAAVDVVSRAIHGTPRMRLRADAAR
jgi:hypothetical protein